jgi:hypothetical protein
MCEKIVRCVAGMTKVFQVRVGLHHGSALSPFLFDVIMDNLSTRTQETGPMEYDVC